MLDLLKAYSLQEVVVFGIMLTFAVKGILETIKYFENTYQNKFNHDYEQKTHNEEINESIQECKARCEEAKIRGELLDTKIDTLSSDLNNRLELIEGTVKQLILSDMHDIKAWIIEKHHYFMEKGEIDDFSMDVINHRFEDYKKEDGNSFVEDLVKELRELHKQAFSNKR